MPCALVASDLDVLLDAVPELRGRAAVAARMLLPGPYTLVLPNPARRYRWLAGTRPETLRGRSAPPLALPDSASPGDHRRPHPRPPGGGEGGAGQLRRGGGDERESSRPPGSGPPRRHSRRAAQSRG